MKIFAIVLSVAVLAFLVYQAVLLVKDIKNIKQKKNERGVDEK